MEGADPVDEDLVGAARPIDRVSTWMPRAPARAASTWPVRWCRCRPRAGRSAAASRRGRARRPGAARPRCRWRRGRASTAIRSMSASSSGSRSTSASFAEGDDARHVPVGPSVEGLADEGERFSRPPLPTESERSTTKTVASRSTGRTSGTRPGPSRARRGAAPGWRGDAPPGRPDRRAPRDAGRTDHQRRDQQEQPGRGARTGCPSGPRPRPPVGAAAPARVAPEAAPHARRRRRAGRRPTRRGGRAGRSHERDPQLVAGGRPLVRGGARAAAGGRGADGTASALPSRSAPALPTRLRPQPLERRGGPGRDRRFADVEEVDREPDRADGSAGRAVGTGVGDRRRSPWRRAARRPAGATAGVGPTAPGSATGLRVSRPL